MRKILVFGGTRFFGKKVVEHFIAQGDMVTLVTRGKTEDGFGDKVKRVHLDRTDANDPNWVALGKQTWHVVFDNIGYTWQEAKIAVDNLTRVKHYLFTSSMAVYSGKEPVKGYDESQFSPQDYTFDYNMEDVSYGEGKRQAESYFEQNALFPITYLRFPVVLDKDDYTNRLKFYVEKALNDEDIIFKRDNGRYGFVHASEIPHAIEHILTNELTGPINVASSEPYSQNGFIELLTEQTGKALQVIISDELKPSPFSSYDTVLNLTKLEHSGYSVTPHNSWFPELISYFVTEIPNKSDNN